MGLLDDLLAGAGDVLGDLAGAALDVIAGISPEELALILNPPSATPPGTVPGMPQIPTTTGTTVGTDIDQILGGFANLLGVGGNGAVAVPGAPGRSRGIQIGGACPGLYHSTPMGRRVPNKVTFMQDPESQRADFYVHAGDPTAWSRVTIKKRHRHGQPRHHRPY